MAETPTQETACYSYRHAAHGGVVHSTDTGDVRDAVATGRVAELLNCTLDDLLKGLPEKEVPLWRAELKKGMEMVGVAAPPVPQTEPAPHRPPRRKERRRPKPPPRPLSTTPDPRLAALRDKHRGSAAVIIASGPSLETPEARAGLDALAVHRVEHDQPLVIGVNRARAVYPRCDYLAVMDHRLYNEHLADHAGWSHLFRGWETRMFIQDIAGWPGGPFIRVRPLSEHVGFSFDLIKGFHRGFTTTLLAMQVAAWLGCEPLYLAGVDLQHGSQGKTHFFGSVPWNHERDGVVGRKGLFNTMLTTFDAVAPLLAEKNVHVYNLNPDSAVRCFPFAKWEDALTGPTLPRLGSTSENAANGLTVGMQED